MCIQLLSLLFISFTQTCPDIDINLLSCVQYNLPVKYGLHYDCGVELTHDGQFGRSGYHQHANRGTYTLHSLYLILWANFAAFSVSLLTQPGAAQKIHGTLISDWQAVRHYCVSQLRTLWMHIGNNLGVSDEERSFLLMRCMNKMFEVSLCHIEPIVKHAFRCGVCFAEQF